MSGPDNKFQQLARDAALSLDRDRDLQAQLSLLPDEVAGAELVDDGKPKRGQGKALNQMREFLAAKGYRLPEDVLAEMAGLASRDDAILTTMANTDRILMWAGRGKESATMGQRLAAFQQVYTVMLRAADALMPYGAPKVTPEVTNNQQVNNITVLAPSGPTRAGDQARDVTPSGTVSGRRIAPPPLPSEVEQNQPLSNSDREYSDREARTK